MKPITVSFFDLASGLFDGRRYIGVDDYLRTPVGFGALEGEHDHLSRRVDVATGLAIDYQPPKPADDADQVWTWQTDTKRWTSARTLAFLKRAKWQEIKAAAHASDQADITIGANVYDADDVSRAALFQAAQVAIMDGVTSMAWHLADGTPIVLTAAQLKAGLRTVAARTSAIKTKAATLRATVGAATTPGAVALIVWAWP